MWRWKHVPEVLKPGLEHHTSLVACFLEKQYLVIRSQQKIRRNIPETRVGWLMRKISVLNIWLKGGLYMFLYTHSHIYI